MMVDSTNRERKLVMTGATAGDAEERIRTRSSKNKSIMYSMCVREAERIEIIFSLQASAGYFENDRTAVCAVLIDFTVL